MLTNVMVLQGPSGSGKSAAVHEAARALGFKVIEVNASQARSGATVKKLIAEAAQSAHIMDNLGGSGGGGGGSGAGLKSGALPLGATDMNLILFDEVSYGAVLIISLCLYIYWYMGFNILHI